MPEPAAGRRRWLPGLLLAAAVLAAAPRWLGAAWLNTGGVRLVRAVSAAGWAAPRPTQYEPPAGADAAGLARAEAALRRLLAWQPAHALAHAQLGLALVWQARYPEAAQAYTASLAAERPRSRLFAAGNAHQFAGQPEPGLALWLEGAHTPELRERLALSLFAQSTWDDYHPNRWRDAYAVLQTTAQDPALRPADAARLYWRLADLYMQSDRLPEAEQALQAALAVEPRSGLYLAYLAWVRLFQGDQTGALAAADEALDAAPGWRAYYVRGSVRLEQCRLAEAEADFLAGLGFAADDYRYYRLWLGLGQVYWETGRGRDALDYFQRYLTRFPESGARERLQQAEAGTLPKACSAP